MQTLSMNALEMAEQFRRLKEVLPDLVGDAIADNAAQIEDLQTEQLFRGEDSEGNQIEPAYTPFTVQIKQSKGQPTDRVTLRDEGDFYRGMFLTGGNGNQFAIGNSDRKAKDLLAKYGQNILGLNDASIQVLIDDHLRPILPERALAVIAN